MTPIPQVIKADILNESGGGGREQRQVSDSSRVHGLSQFFLHPAIVHLFFCHHAGRAFGGEGTRAL